MNRFNKRGLYHTTKDGHPILIERFGETDFKQILKNFSVEDVFNYYLQFYERLVHIVFPICSERAGKRIDKIFSIVDLKNSNLLSLLNSNAKEFLKKYAFLS
jgi:hypothetical protein